MSQLTENTIVIETVDVEKFYKAIEYHQNTYSWIINVKKVYEKNDIAIFTFDCNGQPLGVEEEIEFLVLETNYLDGEPMYTQVYDKEIKRIRDATWHAKYWIKKLIGESDFNSIKDCLIYSDGRL